MNEKKARLILEDGSVFMGRAFAPTNDRYAEIVFNTAMTGYQEILTDPSYEGQAVVMTYPMVGSYGINEEDVESRKLFLEALLVKEYVDWPSNWRSKKTLKDYLIEKTKEIKDFNKTKNIDTNELINGRRLTNIGTFRAYIINYLRNHPKIHSDMTFLVRHLAPTENGLPIEIYVFSNDQVWAHYEAIQADIFDHVLAVIPEFDLRVFQNPTGADFQVLKS